MIGLRRHRAAALVLASAAVFSLGVSAETARQADFTPAAAGNGENSFQNVIEFPELRGDTTVEIGCLGLLENNGKFDEHLCYRVNPGDDTFIRAIAKSIRKVRFVPATLDGKDVDVVFQYRAKFVKAGDDETIEVIANPGVVENVEAYGSDHVAAQRVMKRERWQDECPKKARFIVLARANVDFDGTPSSVSLQHMDGIRITEKCSTAIEQNLLASAFIPAEVDGETVPSTYIEPFGN